MRRSAAELAGAAGLDETVKGQVAIAVTEMCTNLLKHAGGGTVILNPVPGDAAVELFALDKGPGMRNIEACLNDGYSTVGTSGSGLGAIRRLASRFDFYSAPQKGTVIYARFGSRRLITDPGLQIAGIRTARAGERICGDNWTWRSIGERDFIIVADGLGHGPLAASASADALNVFCSDAADQPALMLQDVHAALRSTRGAAVAIARVDLRRAEVVYAGLGNISGAIVTAGVVRHLVSYNGTAGHEARKIAEFTYPWSPDGALIVCSDGLTTQWSVRPYPGLLRRSPELIAGVLYRDYLRGRDDATVVVAKQAETAAVL
ncbi:MAG TPA: SpoIIE family protein phosphatase [Bryobacteraceae bacterium]|nr:SpoIIE family protein phosphatase [Bryobacteraceae bacterium]